MSYLTSSKRSPPVWLLIRARKLVFFWHQSEARTVATVWNWSGKTLSPGALVAVLYFSSFHIYFSARLDFPSSPLSAPGSPRMTRGLCVTSELSFMCSFTLEKSLAPRVLACKHINGHFVHHCCHCLNIFSFIYSLFHHMLFLLAMVLHLLQVRMSGMLAI